MKLGIISGIHEDIIRLEEALGLLKSHACERIICLGDIVGYSVPYYGFFNSRSAHASIELTKQNCDICVLGNHDAYATNRIPKNSHFSYPDNWYSLTPYEKSHTPDNEIWDYLDELPAYLEPQDRAYLNSLPEYSIQHFDSVNILLSHYVMPNVVGDSKELSAEKDGLTQHFAFMKESECQISIFAHDLQSSVRMFHEGGDPEILPFGKHALKDFPIALNSSWVANGTEENGVMILDTEEVSIEAIPLNTPPHPIPDWFDK